VVVTGDGSFGFNAIELDTAVRHKAQAVFVVANNGAWQIEVHDQTESYGRVVGTRLQFADHAALARELVIGETPYIIPYRVRANAVEILRVFHAARKWPKRF